MTHPQHSFHVAATVRVVYRRKIDEKFKTGAYFLNFHSLYREKLAQAVALKLEQESANKILLEQSNHT